MRHAHKVGAVFYVLWGLLHVLAGVFTTIGRVRRKRERVGVGR